MAMKFERINPFVQSETPAIGNNSEVFTKGDPVYIDSDGFLAHVTTSSVVYGYAAETVTMASDNETVAKVRPLVQPALGSDMRVTSAVALARTDVGNYADLSTASTGADVLSGTTGTTSAQFFVKDIDPDRDGTLTVVIVGAAEIQGLVGASQAI